MKKRSHRRGFTLTELLICLGIVALLCAVLFPVFFTTRKKTKETVCISQLQQIGQALRMYTQDYDDYPRYRDFSFHAIDKIHPAYLSDFMMLKCPSLPLELSGGLSRSDYGYFYKIGPELPLPPNEQGPKDRSLLWEEAYAKRGESLPLVSCNRHGVDLNNTPVGDKSLVTDLVLRMDGSISKSVKSIPHDGTGLHWYDY